MIDLANFETYDEVKFISKINEITPIDEFGGYLRKRDDLFNMNGIKGGKVRQCAKLVYDNLEHIHKNCQSTIVTAAGLPSPQSVIVSAVAKYFGLKCKISVPYYREGLIDYNRINVSLAQKFGAEIYAVGNPNTTGPEKDVEKMVKENGYFWVKFGMNGDNVTRTISEQVVNIPNTVKNIVVISGSGLSAIGIIRGLAKYKKGVTDIHVVALSDYFNRNKEKWYDTLPTSEKWDGNINVHMSTIPYQKLLKIDETYQFDLTYESKAWKWMTENIKPSTETLFWMVGVRDYDIRNIEPIRWYKSTYELSLDVQRSLKTKVKSHKFW